MLKFNLACFYSPVLFRGLKPISTLAYSRCFTICSFQLIAPILSTSASCIQTLYFFILKLTHTNCVCSLKGWFKQFLLNAFEIYIYMGTLDKCLKLSLLKGFKRLPHGCAPPSNETQNATTSSTSNQEKKWMQKCDSNYSPPLRSHFKSQLCEDRVYFYARAS